MARYFEKISFEQFKKDVLDDKILYDAYHIPKRATKQSAGYDYESVIDFTLTPGEIKKIPLGIKVCMNPTDVLLNVIRSSQGLKYNVRMCNQTGVIDADYYNNSNNEGHIWICLQNHGDQDYVVKSGDRICQGIFTSYLTTDQEENIEKERTSGFGSTN